MSWKLALEYVRVLIWPSIVLTLGILFKQQIANLLKRLQAVDTPVGSASFAEQFAEQSDAVGRAAEEIEAEIITRLSTPNDISSEQAEESESSGRVGADFPLESPIFRNHYRGEISSLDPTATVLSAWLRVERAMHVTLEAESGSSVSDIKALRQIGDRGLLPSQSLSLAHELLKLKNQALRGSGSGLTRESADAYVSAASKVIDALTLSRSPTYRAMRYQEEVFFTLRDIVGGEVKVGKERFDPDFVVTSEVGKSAIVEVKYRSAGKVLLRSLVERTINQAKEMNGSSAVLIVTNAGLSDGALLLNAELADATPPFEVVQWMSAEDNHVLMRAWDRVAR